MILLTILLSAIIVPFVIKYVKNKAITREPTKKEITAVRTKHAAEISDLETKMRNIEATLRKSVLPANYHYSLAVNWMVEAVLSKRADTLKEVINLYEDYLQKERHNAELKEAIENIEINYFYY